MKGRVIVWNDERGFGFIEAIDGGETIFFHIKAMAGHVDRPQVGETLLFTVTKTQDGKICAVNVKRPAFTVQNLFSTIRSAALYLFAVLFLAVLWRPISQGKISPFVLWGMGAISSFTFCIYRFDKWAAKRNYRRVPEVKLLMLALLGGWPGALFAQLAFRHKCSKPSFQVKFWLIVALNCGVGVGLSLLMSMNLQWPSIPDSVKPHEIKIRPRFHGSDEAFKTDPRFQPQQGGKSRKRLVK